jgi:hypothetical protein
VSALPYGARRWLRENAAALLFVALITPGCHRETPADSVSAEPPPPPSARVILPATSASPAVVPSVAPSSATVASATASATPAASTSASPAITPGETAGKEAHAPDPQNRKKPELTSQDLTGRARHLFDALAADDPEKGRDFFFPRDPFVPLKDVKDAGKYWDQLFRIYANDIHELARRHKKDLADAEFVSFELGTPPKWVKPGEEANKIGYFRTFNGKLRYRSHGKERDLEVKTIISWDDGWYVTHLLPIKH